jgi:hypothetical protein
MLWILCNLFGMRNCPNVEDNRWDKYINDKDKKIYIIDYANFYHSIFYEYKKTNQMDLGLHFNEVADFKRFFAQKFARFLFKRVIEWDSMVIIINKTLGPDAIDPEIIVAESPALRLCVGINLLILSTYYINPTDPPPRRAQHISGCCDDFCFWMIVIGLVGVFIKKIYLEGNLSSGQFNFQLSHFMRKLRLVTNDKQNIGVNSDKCDALHTPKTIFSDLIPYRNKITCAQLRRGVNNSLIYMDNQHTYNYLNIFVNLCILESTRCYWPDYIHIQPGINNNPQLSGLDHPTSDYCMPLVATLNKPARQTLPLPATFSMLDDNVSILFCTVPIINMKFAFVTLIAKIQKLIGYSEKSMRKEDMYALLKNDMD